MIWALLLVPLGAGLVAFALRPNLPRRVLLVATAATHTGLVAWAWTHPATWTASGHAWIGLDAAALVFLTAISLLFLASAVYAVGYLVRESHSPQQPVDEDEPFENYSESVFVGCLLAFLGTMTLVTVSRHLGLIWVAVEATTLASAPLIYFHRHQRSLEATWKYLVICSVGIALALLGNFFLAVAARAHADTPVPLVFQELMAHAQQLDPAWLQAAFLFFLVGYGTKMGLAPLHTWLPDAHSEAPSVVSALLSGALLNCAFLALFRVHALLGAAGQGNFSRELLILFGLFSMAVAAVFILRQADYKRMLAYSSVEHMGILALGVGVGGLAAYGSMLHAVNHSLTKGMLFLAAGNILACYRTKSTAGTRGLLARLPVTGLLWLLGFLAITGSPPFGPFLSELTILKGILDGGSTAVAVVYLAALALAFIGMATIVLEMLYARPDGGETQPAREPLWSVVPPAVLGAATLVLGVWLPPQLDVLLHSAAALVGGN
jgi:hydrogenase-4 component F